MTRPEWPVADFDPVRRLRVIAATSPGVIYYERVLEASFASVWAVAADLEDELPRWLFPDIRSVRVTPGDADRSVAHVTGYSGLRARFDVELIPGWCLMQSRFLLGGMAAVPEHGATRFAFLSGFRGPRGLVKPVTRPLNRPIGRRVLNRFAQRVDQHETRRRI